MKKLIFIFILGIVLISCNNSETSKKVDKSQLNFVNLEIAVDGMTCEGCENTVQTELMKLDGVGEVKASHVNKLVEVKVDTTVTRLEEIESHIDRVGYTIIKQ